MTSEANFSLLTPLLINGRKISMIFLPPTGTVGLGLAFQPIWIARRSAMPLPWVPVSLCHSYFPPHHVLCALLPLRVRGRVVFGVVPSQRPTPGLPLCPPAWEHQPSLRAPVAGAVPFYSLPGAWSEIMNGFIGNQLPIHKRQPGSASCSHPSQRGRRAGSRTAPHAVNKDGCFTHTS